MQMPGNGDVIAKIVLVAVLSVLAIIGMQSDGSTSMRRLDIDASAGRAGAVQVFFDTGHGFNEAESGRVQIGTTRATGSIKLPQAAILKLRIDPDPQQPWLRLYGMRIVEGSPDGRDLALSGLRPKKGVVSFDKDGGHAEARMKGDSDPQLILDLEHRVDAVTPGTVPTWLVRDARSLFWLLALAGVAVVVGRRRKDGHFSTAIPWMLAMAGMLALSMAFATTTAKSVHPDEFTHVHSALYYVGHWIPGAVADPAMASTYDPIWGISYINNWDVAYFFAGKCAGLWATITGNPVVALRLFNVSLLLVLAVFAALRREYAMTCSVLLLTPQTWYVFAYFNGDALPLFLSVLAVGLVAAEDNPVSKFIREGGRPAWQVVLFAAAVGLLLVSKRNYLVVVFFVGMLMTWRHFAIKPLVLATGFLGAALAIVKESSLGALGDLWPTIDRALGTGSLVLLGAFAAVCVAIFFRKVELRPAARRMVLIFLLAGIVATPRVGVDLWINGSPGEKAEQVAVAAEVYAQDRFKPSTVSNNIEVAYPGLRFAKRGISLPEMLWTRHAWIERSWRSSLGMYGHMNVYAPPATYWLLTIGILVFVGSVLVRATRDRRAAGTAWIGLGSLVLVVLSSVSFSWFYGYQPQGRYLLAAVPIFGAVVAATGDCLNSRWTQGALMVCLAVSLISFTTAMGQIP
ncbi:hypothetical protein [Pseudoxanthomonas sangjuensis]|uniref:hypothetical protein n=1 Tax=Pseudoxanthomonas sangjuensis TaxID=1503750 RepID=UPI0013911CED|nr:hypothetical protein [Pseudoxanthomonas sangjuensis]